MRSKTLGSGKVDARMTAAALHVSGLCCMIFRIRATQLVASLCFSFNVIPVGKTDPSIGYVPSSPQPLERDEGSNLTDLYGAARRRPELIRLRNRASHFLWSVLTYSFSLQRSASDDIHVPAGQSLKFYE